MYQSGSPWLAADPLFSLFRRWLLPVLLVFSNRLHAQTDDSWKVYDDAGLARVDITIDPAKLQWIYANARSDSEHVASMRFRNMWFDETIDSIGFRLRGNTSRDSQKKSFKVSLNSFIKGRKFHGVEKINLNGEHNDPSIIRSKLCFDLYRDIGTTASRAAHARVYINGAYYGLYISVEHVDDEFLRKNVRDDSGNLWKCLYPADLTYKGDDPSLYKSIVNNGVPAYELTTNEDVGDYAPLARLIRIINRTPKAAFQDSLESILDVPTVLKCFAMDVLVGGWDDYRSLMNNYYLYYEPSADRFTFFPYDYDNTFGVDWFSINWSTANPYNFPKVSSGSRPLSETVLAENTYRDLFTHFLKFFSTSVMPLPLWESRIDRIRDTITLAALEDTYRVKDWGFTAADFGNSYSSAPYQNQHVKFGLKQFINLRNAGIGAQLSNTSGAPIAYRIVVAPEAPAAADSITITAACFASTGIKSATILFTPAGGTVQTFPLVRRGVAGTKIAEEADRWIGVIPPLGPGVTGTVRIQLTDSLNQTNTYPRVRPIKLRTPAAAAPSVMINEFLADNTFIFDPDGEFDDWIELFNPTPAPVLLTGKYMTDNPAALTKWRFTQPNLVIRPGGFQVIWCDDDLLQVGIHAGFKLSASGEYAALVDSDGVTVLDSITFGPQTKNRSFGRTPDGASQWSGMAPTPGWSNEQVSDIADQAIARAFTLAVYPNPLNPSTTFTFQIRETGDVSLAVYDLLGRRVATVLERRLEAGAHVISWNPSGLSAGVYVARLSGGGILQTVKLSIVK